MSGWSIIVYVCMPIPLLLLTILTVPLPKCACLTTTRASCGGHRSIRRGVLAATKRIILLPLVGGMQAVHVVMMITAAAVMDQVIRTAELRGRERPMIQADVEILKGKIWRSERNFWIALFCFFIWWMLSAYYRTLVKLIEVKDENEQLKKQMNPGSESQRSPTDKKND